MEKRRSIPQSLRNHIASRQEWRCNVCRELFDEVWEIDHIDPLHRGGADSVENFQALCLVCHRKKSNRENLVRHGYDPDTIRAPPVLNTIREPSTEKQSPDSITETASIFWQYRAPERESLFNTSLHMPNYIARHRKNLHRTP